MQVDVYEKASRVGGMTYTMWDTAPLVDHNVDRTSQVLVKDMHVPMLNRLQTHNTSISSHLSLTMRSNT